MWVSDEKGKPGRNSTVGEFKGNMEKNVAECVEGWGWLTGEVKRLLYWEDESERRVEVKSL